MPDVLMNDPTTQRTALFEEAPGGGDFDDPNSNRNRPLNDPASWLDLVKFHSDFDYYQLAMDPVDVTVNHLAIAGASTTVYSLAGSTFTRQGQMVENTYTLLAHGLDYVPKYMIISGGKLIAPGTIIQVASNRDRMITPFADETNIGIWEVGTSSASALTATSVDYTVLVFKQPEADYDFDFDFDQTTGRTILGFGKFDSSLKTLRKAGASVSPFDISLGRTVDIKNGGARTVLADGTTVSDTLYDGTFAGSDSIQCAVE